MANDRIEETTQKEVDVMAETSEKKRLVAFLLWFFLWPLGVHRFYVGKVGSGIAQVLTFGGLGIWALVDLRMILCGAFKDKEGNAITEWT
jgi:TM2 domain-containing membrane protein YozV